MKTINLKFNRGIYPVLTFFVLSIVLFMLSRTALLIWHPEGTEGHIIDIYKYGLLYDVSINCTMYAVVVLICILSNFLSKVPAFILILQKLLLSLIITIQLLLEISTPSFIIEYGVRPNHIYVEYLIYPKEVLSTLVNGHLFESLFCILICITSFILFYKLASKLYRDYTSIKVKKSLLCLVLAIVLIPYGIRGTITNHKPLNPSNSSFCTSPLGNTIPVNSTFNVFYALRHISDSDIKSSSIFAFDNTVNVLNNYDKFSKVTKPKTIDSSCPINQVITPKVTPSQKRNVVIIVEESFGARYVQSLSGDPIAPELEKLKNEGWWFERLYATGHRSVRGLEAITASYPPSPLASQVKLEHREELTTISSIYKRLGYKTSFIYGGESHFDSMRSYFLNNGVEEIIEQKDYKDPEFVASWGVSDEDLFKKANEKFVKLSNNNQPFCSVVFSSSFHDPFDIPQGKVNIDGVKTDDPRRLTAAKYADYALGKFFEQAKKEDYYKNTVFLVIADHDSRVRGIGAFPLTNYSIPALIISTDITPRVDKRIVSQIDMLPTLLSLTGVSGEFPLSGEDLTRDDIIERAPVSYNELFGYVKGDKFTLLVPGTAPIFFKIGEHNTITESNSLSQKDLSVSVSVLNLGIQIYENNFQRISCMKGLKQE
ncbi:MAG: LTA synthase family protein [Succinatimonas sp.]|nr:LTA synthase family protein [Succinatimonas sp.]MDD6377192.1 LTA synthase family protein [Succinatimonas sp.]